MHLHSSGIGVEDVRVIVDPCQVLAGYADGEVADVIAVEVSNGQGGAEMVAGLQLDRLALDEGQLALVPNLAPFGAQAAR